MRSLRDEEVRRWAHGDCHALTAALHIRTGWPVFVLHDSRFRCGPTELFEFGEPVHSGVLCPDGAFLDAYGTQTDLAVLVYRYEEVPGTVGLRPDAAPDLRDVLMLIPSNGPERRSLLREALACADRVLSELAKRPAQHETPSP